MTLCLTDIDFLIFLGLFLVIGFEKKRDESIEHGNEGELILKGTGIV
jgi:hypothetical protein